MRTTMKLYFGQWLAAVLAALMMMVGLAHADTGSTGKEFYFAFQPNSAAGTSNLSLFITGRQDTQGSVEIPGIGFSATYTIQANKVTTVALPAQAQYLTDDAVSKLAVHVTAQSDVTVYGLNTVQYSSDGFLALPIDALGLEYFALSYTTTFGGYPSQIAIVAAYDNTQVTITPAVSANGHAAGTAFSVALNRGETYQVSSPIDVTGMHITANVPVAVMSGVNCVNIPAGVPYCNHIVEMMPPVSAWGTSFLSVPLATRSRGDVFRVVASQDGTRININGVLAATLNRGQFFETILATRSQIDASSPVLLAQYSAGSSFDGASADPFMMLIPPTEQFLNQYSFSTPATGFPANYVNVVIPSGDISHLLLDGVAANANVFSAIGTSGLSGGQLPLGVGAHTLATSSDVPFGIYIYGFYNYDGYGYLGGMSFKAINRFGDPYAPTAKLVLVADTIQGTAIDGEDLSGNGVITPRSAIVNGLTVRDTGVFRVELLADASNLKLNVVPYVPGTLKANFSISRIDTALPGSGTLHIEDGVGNKYETPVALGDTASLRNVRLFETLNASNIDIDPASFQIPPFGVTSANGQTVVEWRFDAFPANLTKDLRFDVIFKNPQAGENRLLVSQLELLYNDVNGHPVRTNLGSEYVNVYPSIYQVTPATDKSVYGPNEVVQITSTMKNLSAFAGAAAVRLSIQSAGNIAVAAVGILPAQTVAAGATGAFTGLNFLTGSTYVGNYKVLAELLDNNGKVLAFGLAPFAVAVAGGQGVKAAITTDKQLYSPLDTVRIGDRITNLLSNTTLDDARAITTVTNPDGTVRFSKTETLPQLTPSGAKDYSYTLPLALAAAGKYTAVLAIAKADGTLLARTSTPFLVASTADTGAGLIGTIIATPTRANTGQSVNVVFSATNNGNSAFANVPLIVSIVDPEKQLVVAAYPYATGLPIGSVFNGTAKWLAAGSTGATFVAVLGADVGGKRITLAQAPFTVLKLDIRQALSGGSRVLALVSCEDEDDDEKPEHDDSKRSEVSKGDGHDKPSVCVAPRALAMDRALTALGVAHTIASTEAAFKLAFRSGLYNTYWLSGKEDKLHDDLASEIREAVFAGDGLILDGVHDERNKVLDMVAGVQYHGKNGETGLTVNINGPLFERQSLPVVGRTLKLLELEGGVQQASFIGTKTKANDPAIVTHGYGAGHAVLFAFDLVSSVQAQALWQPELAAALHYALPAQAPSALTPGSLLSLKTAITNQGAATDVNVKSTLPAGAMLLGSNPTGILDASAHAISWGFNLAKEQGKDLLLTLRVPPTAGDYSVQTSVSTVNAGALNPYGNSLVVPLKVVTASQISGDVVRALKALVFKAKEDQKRRDDIVAEIQGAMVKFNLNTARGYEAAIGELIETINQLGGLTSVDTRAIHDGLDQILREAQWRWDQVAPLNNSSTDQGENNK